MPRVDGSAQVGTVKIGLWTACRPLESIVPMLAPQATVCIDIPIGLSSDGFRACDRAARQLLGKRSSSVFPVPPRLALAPLSYEEINLASKAHCGKGVSKQAFYPATQDSRSRGTLAFVRQR